MTKSVFIFLIGLSVLAFLVNGAANWIESRPISPKERFAVVDTYRGCDVVEYSPDYAARYYYFLHCK